MFGIGGIIKIVAILAIVVIIASGLYYVTGLRADIATLKGNNEKLEDGIKKQELYIQQMENDIKEIKNINAELDKEKQRQQQEIQSLSDKFNYSANGQKRDLGEIANKKPKSVQRAINNGTKNAIRCLELATGAELNEKEKNAKLPSEANRECPSLIDPDYTPIIK